MTLSRRNVLLRGCAIGAGVIAANMPGIVALAQAGLALLGCIVLGAVSTSCSCERLTRTLPIAV